MRFVLALLAAVLISGCCKPNQPPSFFCKLQEKTVACGKEVAVSGAPNLAQELIKALRAPGWQDEVQALVNVFGDAAICILGNLGDIFASKPQASPAELKQRAQDLEHARQFLTERKLRVVKKADPK